MALPAVGMGGAKEHERDVTKLLHGRRHDVSRAYEARVGAPNLPLALKAVGA